MQVRSEASALQWASTYIIGRQPQAVCMAPWLIIISAAYYSWSSGWSFPSETSLCVVPIPSWTPEVQILRWTDSQAKNRCGGHGKPMITMAASLRVLLPLLFVARTVCGSAVNAERVQQGHQGAGETGGVGRRRSLAIATESWLCSDRQHGEATSNFCPLGNSSCDKSAGGQPWGLHQPGHQQHGRQVLSFLAALQ
jgi:hypothetical protein